jgi:P27 family predicted phage terminase small subunit
MSNPPVPFHLAKLRGNPGKRRLHPEPEMPKAPECPEPPGFLADFAKEEWRRAGPSLHAAGILTDVDLACFGVYCQASADWHEAVERLALSPERDPALVRAARQAGEHMIACASHFGLTPVARARVARGTPPGRPPSKFAGLLA